MITYNPLLCLDFYKTCHAEQYPKGLTKMVSYYTPRMSRLGDTDKVTLFGLQAFIQEYLIEAFSDHFFNVPFDSVLKEYNRVLGATIGTKGVGEKRLRELHDLGYLPLQIRAVPEGTRTNIKVPQIEISNTHPNFVWLVNTIETMLSCTMWHTQVSAEVGYRYRKIVNEYAERTCDDNSLLEKNGFAINNVSLGVGSFSMECLETIESDGSKQYNPYTRDTFGIAVKATYAEDADGKPIMIFKNPKTDTGHFKKSQRGCCRVVKTGDGYDYVDGLTWAEAQDSNELRTVFRDGKFEKQFTLDEVRKNLHGGTF